MARNGATGGAGFINATVMLPGGSAFALATTAAGAPPAPIGDDDVHVVAGATTIGDGVGAADGAIAAARPPMRWIANTSGFVLRRMKQQIESGARADKGINDKEVNQVAKQLREYCGEEVSSTQVYNHLRKWRQRWGRISKLKDLSGALWDVEVRAIMLDPEDYIGHIKVLGT